MSKVNGKADGNTTCYISDLGRKTRRTNVSLELRRVQEARGPSHRRLLRT